MVRGWVYRACNWLSLVFIVSAIADLALNQWQTRMKSAVIRWISLAFGIWLCLMSPAIASIHTYPEGADRVMIRSLQTVRDRADQAWQLVLFKRVNAGQTESIHLRIVGFPGQAQFPHADPLKIATSTSAAIIQSALPDPSPFPDNISEYDIQDFVIQLTSNSPLQLVLPTLNHETELIVPPFVVKEWRELANSSPKQ